LDSNPELDTYYIVTDVVFKAFYDLQPLVNALIAGGLGPVFAVRADDDGWAASGGILVKPYDPESSIARFLDVLDSLDIESKRFWSNCSMREFDIGYHCGTSPFSINNAISSKTVARIAANLASLKITLYSVDLRDPRREFSA